MLVVAILAGLFAVFEVTEAVGMLIAISTVFLPTVIAARGRRLHTAAWVVSLYPVLLLTSLYATWLTAWCVLGHRPRSFLDDPKFISPLVEVPYVSTGMLMLGFPFALFLCVPLLLADVGHSVLQSRGVLQRRVRLRKGAVQLVVRLCVWLSFLIIPLWWDHLGISSILGWYMD
jgi:hypothetical protein